MSVDLATLEQTFDHQGFLVLPDALAPAMVAELNQAIDRDLAQHRDAWFTRSDNRLQDANVLPRTSDFDDVLQVPAVVDILRRLMGESVCLEEFSIMLRDPLPQPPDRPGWHRDFARAESQPLDIHSLSVVYYLTDVTPADHCFAIVPQTHHARIDEAPGTHDPADEVDILGQAGTALIFHTACVHAGKLKPHARQRRTLHLYYGYADQPRVSAHTDIPDRLAQRRDPDLPTRFYTQKIQHDPAATDATKSHAEAQSRSGRGG